jgi:hypothetical protein
MKLSKIISKLTVLYIGNHKYLEEGENRRKISDDINLRELIRHESGYCNDWRSNWALTASASTQTVCGHIRNGSN